MFISELHLITRNHSVNVKHIIVTEIFVHYLAQTAQVSTFASHKTPYFWIWQILILWFGPSTKNDMTTTT